MHSTESVIEVDQRRLGWSGFWTLTKAMSRAQSLLVLVPATFVGVLFLAWRVDRLGWAAAFTGLVIAYPVAVALSLIALAPTWRSSWSWWRLSVPGLGQAVVQIAEHRRSRDDLSEVVWVGRVLGASPAGQGLGGRLGDVVQSAALDRGVSVIELEAMPRYVPRYKRRGFVVTKRTPIGSSKMRWTAPPADSAEAAEIRLRAQAVRDGEGLK